MKTKKRRVRRGNYIDLCLHPTFLTQMVVKGYARIVGKDEFRRNIYEVATNFTPLK